VSARVRSRTRAAQEALILLLVLSVAGSACAPRTAAVPAPGAPAHPEFVFPAVPQTWRGTADADRLERGWRYLQSDHVREAEREFSAAQRRSPGFYPAITGSGYVALARREYNAALTAFDHAIRLAGAYPPALVGRGQTLLGLRRDQEALTAFEAALALDPSLADVRQRIEVLRFRTLQDVIATGRRQAADGRLDEARATYERALEASPDSAFLHRELGVVERRRGHGDAALDHLRKASALDPSDVETFLQLGDTLEQRQDFAGAEAAYRQAAALDPSNPQLGSRMARVAERAREAALPAEFGAIARSNPITRGELAALIGVRLAPVVGQAQEQPIVITDARDHWASEWITSVARAGVIPPFPNHTFQPRTQVRRVDLAEVVSQLVTLLAGRDPKLRSTLAERPGISDVSPAHRSYPDIAVAVASGVLPLLEGQRFDVTRPVTGAEAAEAVERLRALAVAP
jgi:tetratricopeptide (TPR) repeat protein